MRPLVTAMNSVTESARQLAVVAQADVLVAGGGVSGLAAAICAGRAGAQTMLLERTSLLGGTATAGLMANVTNHCFEKSGRQVVKGFTEEFLNRLAERNGGLRDWRHAEVPQVPFDPEVFQLVAMEMVREVKVRVWLETWAVGVLAEEGKVTGIVVETRGGRKALRGKVTVDCTGDADLACLAGAEMRVGHGGHSLEFRMGNVGLERAYQFVRDNARNFIEKSDVPTLFADFCRNWEERGLFHLPHGGGREMPLLQEAIKRGEFKAEDGRAYGMDSLGMYAVRGDSTVIVNANFFRFDVFDPDEYTAVQFEAREKCFYVADFLGRHFPGFENAFIVATAPTLGLRRTRCITGAYVLNDADLRRGAQFDDVVGLASEIRDEARLERAVEIPYRCLLPQRVEGLLVASGKTISTDPCALIRGQAHCMTIGQAAGVAAALSARPGVVPSQLDVKALQRALLVQNVFLGDADRLSALGLS